MLAARLSLTSGTMTRSMRSAMYRLVPTVNPNRIHFVCCRSTRVATQAKRQNWATMPEIQKTSTRTKDVKDSWYVFPKLNGDVGTRTQMKAAAMAATKV